MPQLYAIRASEASRAIVIAHQGAWFHLARWNLDTGKLERGAWFRGTIYQRRCDVSPDGALFYYFGMKRGQAFHAVSRVPWLTALAFWRAGDTYSRGWHFERLGKRRANEEDVSAPGWVHTITRLERAPDEGSISPLASRHKLKLVANGVQPYGSERRRGWLVHPEASPRPKSDVWFEKTPQWLYRDRPGGEQRLALRDEGYTRGRFEGRAPRYTLDGERLADVSWADWDTRGRLLVTTRAGTAEIRNSANKIVASASLADWEPDPKPSPAHARRW